MNFRHYLLYYIFLKGAKSHLSTSTKLFTAASFLTWVNIYLLNQSPFIQVYIPHLSYPSVTCSSFFSAFCSAPSSLALAGLGSVSGGAGIKAATNHQSRSWILVA